MDPHRSRLAVALLLLAVAAPAAAAQLVPIGPEQLVHVGPLSCPVLAARWDGSYGLAWQGWDPPGNDPRYLAVRVVDADDVLLARQEIDRAAGAGLIPERLAPRAIGFALQWLHASLVLRQRRFQALDDHGAAVGSRFAAPESWGLSERPVGGYIRVQPTHRALQVQRLNPFRIPIGRAVSIGDRNVVLWWVEHQPNGGFVVLYWSLQRSGNLSTDLGVRAVWFDGDGKLASQSVLVVPPWARRNTHGLGADGTLAVTYNLVSAPGAVVMRAFSGHGRPRGRPTAVLPGDAYHTLAVDGGGNVLLTWISTSAADEVRARLFSARGIPLGPELVVPETSPGNASGVSCPVAAHAGSSWVVSWAAATRLPEPELRARRLAVVP